VLTECCFAKLQNISKVFFHTDNQIKLEGNKVKNRFFKIKLGFSHNLTKTRQRKKLHYIIIKITLPLQQMTLNRVIQFQ